MNINSIVEQYMNDGYAVIPGVFSESEVRVMSDESNRLWNNQNI